MPAEAEPRVAILGGGVCGLYAALELTAAGIPTTVVEREASPGGLAAGFKRGDNHYDLGVHMLHGFDEEILARIKELMQSESTSVELNAKIRWIGRDFRYPLQFRDMVSGVPPLTLARCIGGLLRSELGGRIRRSEPANAEEALVQLYGRPLYEFFFEQFTRRYWGTPPDRLSAAFVKTKMPRLSARDAVLSILRKLGVKPRSDYAVASALLEETLHYSRTGAEAMPRKMVERIRAGGGEVLLDCNVRRLRVDAAGAPGEVEYDYRTTGRTDAFTVSHCISTIPLPRLMQCLDPPPPAAVSAAADQLQYKPIVVYGLLVDKPRALDAQYVYYRDRIFHRVGEPKNAGLQVVPADHTILLVEMTCNIGDDRWTGAPPVRRQLFEELEMEGVCTQEQVVEQHVLQCAEGYPIFTIGFEKHLGIVTDHLAGTPHLYSTGRQGAFCYPNMHGSMRMGADAARSVLDALAIHGAPAAAPAR